MTQYLGSLAILKVAVSLLIAQVSEFVPEEYWHTTEIAHKLVYNRGHWPWECYFGVKSSLWPVITATLYQIGHYLEISSNLYQTLAPQLVQAIITWVGYRYFFEFTRMSLPRNAAEWSNIVLLVNWFTTYCGARLIEEQTQFSLNCIGLWCLRKGYTTRLGCIIALSLYLRPTAIIFWAPFWVDLIFLIVQSRMRHLLITTILSATIIAVGNYMNKTLYGDIGMSWYGFFYYTILKGGSAKSAGAPLFYLFEALPKINLIPFITVIGMFAGLEGIKHSTCLMIFIIFHSFIDHKEMRYMLPGLPIAFIIMGCAISKFQAAVASLDARGASNYSHRFRFNVLARMWILLNILVTLFIGFQHQIGSKPVANFLNTNLQKVDTNLPPKVWFMMPCYTMPIYTYMSHPTAQYTHYACMPPQLERLYKNGENVLMQISEDFGEVDLRHDIQSNVQSFGLPHFIVTTEHQYANVTIALAKNNLTYKLCYFHYNAYKGAPHRLFVLCDPTMLLVVHQS